MELTLFILQFSNNILAFLPKVFFEKIYVKTIDKM